MHTKKRIVILLIVAALFSLLIASSRTITNSARIKFTENILAPVLKNLSSVSSAVKNVVPFASLRQENKILRQRLSLYERKFEELKMLAAENERLKVFINFRKNIPYTTVPAQVIGRDPTNWSNSLVIDKGLTGGVKVNKAALSTRGLVGRVIEAGKYSARVLLITDPNSKVGVLIQRNRQGGILLGRPDGRCKMVYIALDSDVKEGDKVITAGFGNVFPRDILVGEVIKVGKEPGRLYKYAIVRTAEDLSRLEEVLCIK